MAKSKFTESVKSYMSSNSMHKMPGGHMMSDKEMKKKHKSAEMKKKRKKMMT